MSRSNAAPGYYLDPLGDAWWRYWDGQAWISQTYNDRFPPRTQFDDICQGEEIRDLGAARERVARQAREDRRLGFLAIGTVCVVLCVGAGAAVGLIESRSGRGEVIIVPTHLVAPHGSRLSPRREVPSP